MRADADRWLRSLPKELAPHREVMLGLMREAERDPGIVDTAWDDALRDSAGVVRRIDLVVALARERQASS